MVHERVGTYIQSSGEALPDSIPWLEKYALCIKKSIAFQLRASINYRKLSLTKFNLLNNILLVLTISTRRLAHFQHRLWKCPDSVGDDAPPILSRFWQHCLAPEIIKRNYLCKLIWQLRCWLHNITHKFLKGQRGNSYYAYISPSSLSPM